MSAYLPPSTARMVVENALEQIRFDLPGGELDERLRFNFQSLYATLEHVPDSTAHLQETGGHIEGMYHAREENKLDAFELARKATLKACGPLHQIILGHKFLQ